MVEFGDHQQVAKRGRKRPLKLRKHTPCVHRLTLLLAVSLKGKKSKRLVVNDRPTHSGPELFAIEIRLGLLKKSSCLQVLVAKQQKSAAVHVIRPGLGYHVDEWSRGMAVLR